MGGSIDVLRVCDESVDLIHYVWERPIDACKIAVDDLIGTDGSADCIIVEHGSRVDRDPAVPGDASTRSVGAFWK